MKTLNIFIALWAAFMWVAQAQTTLFNQIYYTDTTSMLSVAGKPIQGGYLIAGGFNTPANYSTFYLRRINNSGVSTALFELDGSYNIGYRTLLFGNSFSKTTDEHYILSGVVGQDPLGYDRDFNVIKIAENGQVIWNKLYEVANELEGNAQIIVLPNGEYLLCGWQYKIFANGSFGPTRFYMAGLNGIGEKLWEKTHGSNANLLHCEQTQDGGFILSGYRYSSITGYDMYVVKTDSLGNLQWQQTYGTQYDDWGGWVKQIESGNYVLIGAISEGNGIKKQLYYTHIDSDGSVIDGTEHFYLKNNNYGIDAPLILLPNNNIIAVSVSFGPPPIWEFAFTKFSPEGEIILETPISSGIGGEDYIRDIEPTPDGGYLLVGFNYTSPAKSWVLKVDSLGNTCGVAPCSSTVVSINPLQQVIKPPVSASIYPNPARGSAQISYTLPPQLPFGVVELYSLQGEKVQYWVLPASGSPSQTQTLDLSGIPSGMYVWRLALPGGYEQYEASGKLIVQ